MLGFPEGVDAVDHVLGGQPLKLVTVPLDLRPYRLSVAIGTGKLALGRTPPGQGGLDRLPSVGHNPTLAASRRDVMTGRHW